MALGSAIEPLIVTIRGDGRLLRKTYDDAIVGAKRFQSKTSAALTSVAAKMKSLGKSATQMGRSLSLKVTAPLVLMGAAAVKAFSDFDNAMTESLSIMKLVGDQAERMRELVLDLSRDVVQGPAELAKSYFFLASAGFDAEEAMAALPIVSRFATAGTFDMALATDLLTDAQSALGLSIGSTADKMANMTFVGNTLVKANAIANASVRQFATSLTSKAGSAFKSFNIPLNEGVALLATYADQGIKAELAGNAVDRMLRLLAQSVAKNSEVFEELNVRVFDAQREFRPFADIILDLENATAGLSTEQKIATLTSLGFEARVQAVILPLLGTSKVTRRYASALKDVGNVMRDVSDKQMTAFEKQMKLVKDSVNLIAIDIGQKLAPTVEALGEFIKDVSIEWKNLSDTSKNWILVLGGIAAAIGPLLLAFGLLSTAVNSMIGLFITLAANAIIAKTAIIGLTIAFTGLIFLGAAAVVLAIADAFGVFGDAIRDSAPQLELINKLMENLLEATKSQIDETKSLSDLEKTRTQINAGLDNATDRRLNSERQLLAIQKRGTFAKGGGLDRLLGGLTGGAGGQREVSRLKTDIKEQKEVFDSLQSQLGAINEIIQKKKQSRVIEEKPVNILPPREKILTDEEKRLKRTNPREFDARQQPGGASAMAIARRQRLGERAENMRQRFRSIRREERAVGISAPPPFVGPTTENQDAVALLQRLVEIEEAKANPELVLPLDLER